MYKPKTTITQLSNESLMEVAQLEIMHGQLTIAVWSEVLKRWTVLRPLFLELCEELDTIGGA